MVKQTIATIMGMPITTVIIDNYATQTDLDKIFDYFRSVDETFSTYKPNSEISRINQKKILPKNYSQDMKTILALAEKTKQETDGYFDIGEIGQMDPSGIVKGWAILQASNQLHNSGFKNYYVEAGGDISAQGLNDKAKKWQVGIRNPFDSKEIVQIVYLSNQAIATSGIYARGEHIYNPKTPPGKALRRTKFSPLNGVWAAPQPVTEIVSLSVIGPDILEADRFATAAFAMGKKGIDFIEQQPGLEGYLIDQDKRATFTTGFKRFTLEDR